MAKEQDHSRRMASLVRKAMLQYQMVEDGDIVVVALSGGKDSLALLRVLHAIKGRGVPSFALCAAHVSGAFSCGAGITTSYLQEICDGMGVPLLVRHADQQADTLECYGCSRQRRSLLFAMAKEAGATKVAFGHHRDDHVQTVLMNLFQKGEFAGNLPVVPMKKYGVTILRPLIFVSEQQIVAWAQQSGLLRAVCRCPVGQQSMRKKTALLVEQLEQLYPHVRENIARAGLLQGGQGALTP